MISSSFPYHIFKAYDIRGLYPDEIDEELAFSIGRAFAMFLQQEEKRTDLSIVVAADMRVSSPQLKQKIIQGITKQGANVVDIGLASTPTFYFAVSEYNLDGGLIVSASHNPKDYNGCKMVRKHAIPISKETGIFSIRDLVRKNEFSVQSKKGKVTLKKGVLSDQINHDLDYINTDKIKEFRIVADPANSMGAQYLDGLFSHIPGTLVKMNFALDGTFPAHQPDPLDEKNLTELKKKVVEENADLGIAADGDGDRLFFVDEKGETVPSHILRGIFAQIFLRKHPHSPICYDIRPGKITEDMILKHGGKPVVTRVGHSLIKEKMREVGAVFAGESSGHYFFKFDHGYYEAPVIMIGKLLEELSTKQCSFSELVQPYKKYVHSGEINSTVDDKDETIKKVVAHCQDAKDIDYLDGVTITYDDYWFNIRPSNTEPLLRLNLEAKNKTLMEQKRDELLYLIRS
mgnify:CR=1 FL=1